MQNPNTMWRQVFFPYISYVSLFLGMGLISGAIVHMPIDPARYTLIMIAGVILFGFASFVNELRGQAELTKAAVVRSLAFSLLLSIGIGMMSGGIQHFSDNLDYSTALIPIGFGVSLFSFVLKQQTKLSLKKSYLLIVLFVALVVPMRMTLNYIAENVVVEGGHGGHGH